MIPYGKQSISQLDVNAVVEVLQSDWLTQGPNLGNFENALAKLVGAESVVAVNSATSALHIACLAIGLGPGDYLWTSPNTFVASANCALYCGAEVDFVDIDSQTHNMSIEALEKKLQQAEARNALPKIVIPVHFAGHPCDMAEIHRLSQKYGFYIIEDASHAVGAKYHGEPVGNCKYSDITVFSFHPVKIMTSGEGGAATTNDATLSEKMRLLSSHAITRNPQQMTHASEGDWYYQQIGLGFNYRMSDIHAALGLSQLHRLNDFLQRRYAIAKHYGETLSTLPVILPQANKDVYSSWHLYVVLIDAKKTNKTRRQVYDYLRSNDIGVNVHYIPVYHQPYYQAMGFKPEDYPGTEAYYENCLSIPIYPDLTLEEQSYVVKKLSEILQ